jgi:hypothetical protein
MMAKQLNNLKNEYTELMKKAACAELVRSNALIAMANGDESSETYSAIIVNVTAIKINAVNTKLRYDQAIEVYNVRK